MSEIIIPNKEKFEQLKKNIIEQGAEKLHVVSDFDRTLTQAFVNGKLMPSPIAVLREEHYISEEYSKVANELFNKYHPIEIDPNILLETKKSEMQKWWKEHFETLIQFGLKLEHAEKISNNPNIRLREGVPELIRLIDEKNIPLVIISSSGLGETIPLILKKNNALNEDTHIVSNMMEWAADGKAVKVKEPIITSMNKDETSVKKFPFYEQIKNRRNVILLGDSTGDIGMANGFDYDNILKIAFLSENVDQNLHLYKELYDVIILNDGPADFVVDLIKEVK